MDLGWVIGALGAFAAIVTAVSAALKSRRDARRSDLEEAQLGRRHILEELNKTTDELVSMRDRLREAELHEAECLAKLKTVTEQVATLASAIPFALLDHRLTEYRSLAAVLDLATDCWAISSPADGGRILFVNAAFARALGRTGGEVVELGWRNLIHPDDMAETAAAEGAAWDGLTMVVNRWQRAPDGAYLQLRWAAPKYVGGVTLALAKVERVC